MTSTAEAILTSFSDHRDKERAVPMQRYMKTEQPFFGIPKPLRAQLLREALQSYPVTDTQHYDLTVRTLWQHSHREAKYAAMDIAMRYKRWINDEHWTLYCHLVSTADWWDTLDLIASNLIGPCLLANRRHQTELDNWAKAERLWTRRASLLAHLKHKEQTDKNALKRTILTLTEDGQFFIQKAIGWALREYSKTNAEWVDAFIAQHGNKLSKLAIREGSKYL